MAAPVTHIICALMAMQSGVLHIEDERAFIIGTSFPDIRYIAPPITRDKTHKEHVTLQEVQQEPNAFQAGVLFHSFIDDLRGNQLESTILPLFPHPSLKSATLLKFFEDMLVYDYVSSWPRIVEYFHTILPEEQAYGISDTIIKDWHTFIQNCCRQKMSTSYLYNIIKFSSLNANFLRVLPSFIPKAYLSFTFARLKKNKQIIQAIHDFYGNFPSNVTAQQSKHLLPSLVPRSS